MGLSKGIQKEAAITEARPVDAAPSKRLAGLKVRLCIVTIIMFVVAHNTHALITAPDGKITSPSEGAVASTTTNAGSSVGMA